MPSPPPPPPQKTLVVATQPAGSVQATAFTTLENSASMPSPVTLTMRP